MTKKISRRDFLGATAVAGAGVVVIGEAPYAEGVGDRGELNFSAESGRWEAPSA